MDNEFITVTYKKKKNKRVNNKGFLHLPSDCLEVEDYLPNSHFLRKISAAETEVKNSQYFASFLNILHKGLREQNNQQNIKEIICYGLGSFSTNVNSRFQFGLLLCLKKLFDCKAFLFDPAFNKCELEVINNFNCLVIETDEKGKRKVKETTLLFLPHCPHWLVNNFLWKNWGLGLVKCIIFSNSFSEIIVSTPQCNLEKELKYISRISSSFLELKIDNTFKYSDIFNNLSFHIFPKDRIESVLDEFEVLEEPVYLESGSEELSKQLETKVTIK